MCCLFLIFAPLSKNEESYLRCFVVAAASAGPSGVVGYRHCARDGAFRCGEKGGFHLPCCPCRRIGPKHRLRRAGARHSDPCLPIGSCLHYASNGRPERPSANGNGGNLGTAGLCGPRPSFVFWAALHFPSHEYAAGARPSPAHLVYPPDARTGPLIPPANRAQILVPRRP